MTWFRGDDKAHCNAKLRAAGLDGTGMHFTAISWCADEETDGFVPDYMLPSLAPSYTDTARRKVVTGLTTIHPGQKRPAWHVEDGGYRINDYLKHNPSHSELEERREAERKRIAAKRAEREGQPDEMLQPTDAQPNEEL